MDQSTLAEKKMKVEVNGKPYEHSLWHLFNGPLPDTFYHLGQVVVFCRIIGNPINPKAQPFFGKIM